MCRRSNKTVQVNGKERVIIETCHNKHYTIIKARIVFILYGTSVET